MRELEVQLEGAQAVHQELTEQNARLKGDVSMLNDKVKEGKKGTQPHGE